MRYRSEGLKDRKGKEENHFFPFPQVRENAERGISADE